MRARDGMCAAVNNSSTGHCVDMCKPDSGALRAVRAPWSVPRRCRGVGGGALKNACKLWVIRMPLTAESHKANPNAGLSVSILQQNISMSSPAFGTPEWSAAKDFAVLMLLTGGNRYAARELWLRKVRIHMEAPPGAGASAPRAAQQVAGRRPKPAPAPGPGRAETEDGRPAREARAQPDQKKNE